jgi:nucleoside-diphosphate-sugar epimerase
MKTVAILGGKGQIARSLAEALPRDWDLRLFSRSPHEGKLLPYSAFPDGHYDLVINAAGPGDPAAHRSMGAAIFRITETLDNLVLDYLEHYPQTGYIYLSTGALYGADYRQPGDADSVYRLPINKLETVPAYHMAKLTAEAKHRWLSNFHIADLRIFGYFTRHIAPNSGFFLAQVAQALAEGRPFATHPTDFVRDCGAPEDLAQLIVSLAEHGVPNGCYDAVSAEPATKFEILRELEQRFHLHWAIENGEPEPCDRPRKTTNLANASRLGYRPAMSTLNLVVREMEHFLPSSLRRDQ